MSRRLKSLEAAWTLAVLGWSGLRILFARTYMADYGVSIWIFVAVEMVSSPVLAMASSRLVKALIDHSLRPSVGWGVVALLSYGAPDAYLLSSGRGLPWGLYGVIVGVMGLAGAASVLRLRQLVRDQVSTFDNL